MFDPSKVVLFLIASAVLIATPGPAVLYIVARGVSQGRTAAVVSALGVSVGNLFHVFATALGLSALMASSVQAFAVLKYAGAAYLVYLGLRKFFSPAALLTAAEFPAEPLAKTFRQGIWVGLLNPKTVLFFVAFFPQFTAPERGPVWLQLLGFGLAFVVMAVIGDSTYGLLSGTLGAWMRRRPRLARGEKYLSGAVYCGLGVATAASRR